MIAPDVVAAVALEPYVVRVVFADGQVRDVDIEPLLLGEVFRPLRAREAFAEVYVDPETRTVAWPDGVDLDPDVVYGLASAAGAAVAIVRTPARA